MMINFLKANISHDILFILAELTIFIVYVGGFIVTAMFLAFKIKEEDEIDA